MEEEAAALSPVSGGATHAAIKLPTDAVELSFNASSSSLACAPKSSSGLNTSAAPFVPSSVILDVESVVEREDGNHLGRVNKPEELTEEQRHAIKEQVEYYFMDDERLANNKVLIKQMRKYSESGGDGSGLFWVPVSFIASLDNIKKLCPTRSNRVPYVVMSLRGSTEIILNSEEKFLARRRPFRLPGSKSLPEDPQKRTVEASNLPPGATVSSLTELFSRCGKVEKLTIHEAGSTDGNRSSGADQGRRYATCLYATINSAQRACRELSDTWNWRAGLRVVLIQGRSGGRKDHSQSNSGAGPGEAGVSAKKLPPKKGQGGSERKRSDSVPSGPGYASPDGIKPVSSNSSPMDVEVKVRRKSRSASIGSNSQLKNEEIHPNLDNSASSKGQNMPQGRVYVGAVQSVEALNDLGAYSGWIKGGNARRTKLAFQGSDVTGESVEAGDLVQYRAWRNDAGQWVALQIKKVTDEEAARLDVPNHETSGHSKPPHTAHIPQAHTPPKFRSPGHIRGEKSVQRFFRIAAGPSEAPGAGFPAGRGKLISGAKESLLTGSIGKTVGFDGSNKSRLNVNLADSDLS